MTTNDYLVENLSKQVFDLTNNLLYTVVGKIELAKGQYGIPEAYQAILVARQSPTTQITWGSCNNQPDLKIFDEYAFTDEDTVELRPVRVENLADPAQWRVVFTEEVGTDVNQPLVDQIRKLVGALDQ